MKNVYSIDMLMQKSKRRQKKSIITREMMHKITATIN